METKLPHSRIGRLLYSTTYIKASKKDKEGKDVVEHGTGFLFTCQFTGDKDPISAILTCRHTVEDSSSSLLHFSQVEPKDSTVGEEYYTNGLVPIKVGQYAENWFKHPDENIDVALIPMTTVRALIKEQDAKCFIHSLSGTDCPDATSMRELEPREPVIFIGYPYGQYDKANNLPLIRSGFTASHPDLRYSNLPGFFVDGHFHPGSSGSPVMIADKKIYPRNNGTYKEFDRFYLLGMATGSVDAPSGPYAGQDTGFGLVISADLLIDTLAHYRKTI